jgi:serine/threonine protein kinase/WD40 repeat protein
VAGDSTKPGHRTPEDEPVQTIQMRPGELLDQSPPVMPTLTGEPVPQVAPPSMPPARYELGEEIARGGMGRVVDATDTLLGRVVALKEALALDAETLRRFARETKITARLEHPSIVPVHDAGTMVGGAPFYVMRKVSGRPLERLVATGETLEQRLALIPHIVNAAHAVAHAHERGIVHRDIKPSNILVGDLGETIVIDWGLAKVIGEADELVQFAANDPEDQIGGNPAGASQRRSPGDPRSPGGRGAEALESIKTRVGVVYGTPGFMAPEQLRGAPVNERCDVYALGATLYHLLSRKPPHHAKTADEMMKAAAHAQATPIGDLVFGVPAELSTIVDKALAHDAAARYQNARELAEDLQRFLTGQLVASHRYTPRERLMRFIRKNRTPVIVATVAAVALIIIGTLAVTRVIGERDRADVAAHTAVREKLVADEQRREAEDQRDKLILQQAKSEVNVNPINAIAMIKRLAAKQWREVRSIASAARATGVAWGLPAPRQAVTLELSRDGQRALVSGEDGSVRVYDLPHRTLHAIIDRGPKVFARFADGERRVVAWTGKQLSVLDASTGARISEVTAPTAINDLEIVGVTAYWVDDAKALWQLDLAGKVPIEIPLEERIEALSPSPDGRWIALSGETHLLLHDRTQPQAPPLEVFFGQTKNLDWSDDGSHLAVIADAFALDVQMTPAPQIVHRSSVGNRQFVAYSTGRIFTIGPTGVGVASKYEIAPRRQLVGDPVGLFEALDGAIVAGSTGGIAVLTDDGDHTLYIPAGRSLGAIAASARSPYVVGMIEGRLLVWDLSEVLPRRLATQAPSFEQFVGNDRVLAAYIDGAAQWIDITTGKTRPLGQWPQLLDIVAAPDGRAACAIDMGRRARIVVEGREPEDLEGLVDIALFASSNQLLLGTLAGTIQLYDVRTKARTAVVSRKAKLVHMSASRGTPTWIAASFADGTLWRKNLASGAESTTALPAIPPALLVTPDGTVVFPDTRAIRVWRTSGSVDQLAAMPKPITAIAPVGADRAVAFSDDGTSYVVELDAQNRITESDVSVGSIKVVASPETGVVVLAQRGAIELFDPIANHRWTLAVSPGLTLNTALISNDGRHVLARRVATDREKRDEARFPTTLLMWTLVNPTSAEETVKWLDAMTNAIADAKSPGGLGWK